MVNDVIYGGTATSVSSAAAPFVSSAFCRRVSVDVSREGGRKGGHVGGRTGKLAVGRADAWWQGRGRSGKVPDEQVSTRALSQRLFHEEGTEVMPHINGLFWWRRYECGGIGDSYFASLNCSAS